MDKLHELSVSAILPAGGKGKRMGASLNKQYIKIKDIPILTYTWRVISRLPFINEIILVVAEGEEEYCYERVVLPYKKELNLPVTVIQGGDERQYSVANGLRALKYQSDYIIIHDGARPIVSKQIFLATLTAAVAHQAAVAAVPVKDTIKMVEHGHVTDTPDRSKLWAVQTPQVFETKLLLEAYQKAEDDEFLGTDDSSLVERLGVFPRIVASDYSNIKITTPEDLITAEKML